MADKKTDKKAAKEAKVVSNLPLDEQLKAKQEELLIARQGLGTTLQNPHRINAIKKDIARILTQINTSRLSRRKSLVFIRRLTPRKEISNGTHTYRSSVLRQA